MLIQKMRQFTPKVPNIRKPVLGPGKKNVPVKKKTNKAKSADKAQAVIPMTELRQFVRAGFVPKARTAYALFLSENCVKLGGVDA